MATHSSILAWRIPQRQRQRSLAGYSPYGCKDTQTIEATQQALTLLLGQSLHFSQNCRNTRKEAKEFPSIHWFILLCSLFPSISAPLNTSSKPALTLLSPNKQIQRHIHIRDTFDYSLNFTPLEVLQNCHLLLHLGQGSANYGLRAKSSLPSLSLIFFLLICLCWVLVVTIWGLYLQHGTQLQHVGFSSLTGIKPRPPALGLQSLSHWTIRGVPATSLYKACKLRMTSTF